ncbi:MAG: DNA polymerase I, partial [Chloroflexota bacterium]
ASMLIKVLGEVKPGYLAVAFDRAAPTFRHIEYEAYKAQRRGPPEGLYEQFNRVRQLLEAFGIPTYELDGFEADDILGTLARKASEEGVETVIVTGDADALQLVSDHVRVLTPRRTFADTQMFDVAGVQERYGLAPHQLIDYKALKGDPSDNIPGVPGVGDKTAVRLLQEYGDLDNIYAHLDEVKGRVKDLLVTHRDLANQSRHLATIVQDVPVGFDLEACRASGYDRARVAELFRELEFRTLLSRLPSTLDGEQPRPVAVPAPEPAAPAEAPQQMSFLGETAPAPAAIGTITVPTALGDYRIVNTEETLSELVRLLRVAPYISLDIETTSLNPRQAALVGFSLAVEPGRAYYIPVGHSPAVCAEQEQLAMEEVVASLKPVLEDPKRPKGGHNIKYDMLVLAEHGVELQGVVFDSMVAAYLLEASSRPLGLKDMAWARLGLELVPITNLIGKGRNQITMAEVPVAAACTYACADADVALRLREQLVPELKEAGLWDLLASVEIPLVPVLARMERVGVALDIPYLKKISDELYQRIKELELRIYAEVGHQFNLNSPQQLGTVLFEELGLPSARRTKTGHSTEAAILERLRGAHPVLDMILEYRQLVKLKSTYVDALPALVDAHTGRVHTSFNQTVASTGRLSSSDPNLQNIPVRTELGRRVRRAFVAEQPDHMLLSADYSQVELRILAHITRDERLLDAFAADEDIHAATAAELFGVPLSGVTSDMRRLAKTVNFGVLYGMSEYGLSQRADLSRQDAAEYIARYLGKYEGVRRYIESTLADARRDGYVSTLLGRRRPIPEVTSSVYGLRQAAERMAINAPIQGTAADIIKLAMIDLDRALRERGEEARMLLQVHDELVLEVPRERLTEYVDLTREMMANAYPLSVPLKVDVSAGPNWDELKDV